ncbi:MAG: hypothetical protein GY708_26930 [Actinomycetia bacterium]|nr:hypothetical protein [Actinomycetes bacterium]
MTESTNTSNGPRRPRRRRPAAASKWLVGAASVATGFGLVAGFAAANPSSQADAGPQPSAEVGSVAQPAPQVVVVRMPSDGTSQAQTPAEPMVIQVPRAVPATDQVPQRATPASSNQQSQVVSESGGS